MRSVCQKEGFKSPGESRPAWVWAVWGWWLASLGTLAGLDEENLNICKEIRNLSVTTVLISWQKNIWKSVYFLEVSLYWILKAFKNNNEFLFYTAILTVIFNTKKNKERQQSYTKKFLFLSIEYIWNIFTWQEIFTLDLIWLPGFKFVKYMMAFNLLIIKLFYTCFITGG